MANHTYIVLITDLLAVGKPPGQTTVTDAHAFRSSHAVEKNDVAVGRYPHKDRQSQTNLRSTYRGLGYNLWLF